MTTENAAPAAPAETTAAPIPAFGSGVPASPAPTPAPAPAPTETPKPEATEGEPAAEAEDDALLGPEDEGEEPAPEAEAEEAEQPEERTPLKAWEPPEGETINEHARPVLEALDAIASNEKQRDEIVGAYQKWVAEQTARLVELNSATEKATAKELKAELGDKYGDYKAQVNAAFKGLSQEDRAQLRTARLADGTLLLKTRVGVALLHQLGAKQAPAPSAQDRTVELQRELTEIDQVMYTNIDQYHKRGWKGRNISAGDRKLEIMRELNSPTEKPSAASIQDEIAELKAYHAREPELFEYSPTWRDTKKTAAQRLYELQTGRG